MKKFTSRILPLAFLVILFLSFNGYAQKMQILETQSYTGHLVRTTPRLSEIDRKTMYGAPLVITRDKDGVIGIGRQIERTEEKIEEQFNNASKHGVTDDIQDPATTFLNTPGTALGASFDGQTSPGLSPTDNNVAVGPNHVIQIVNNIQGSQFTIWNKTGVVVQPATILATVTGFPGFGDPIVLYDQLADRWVMMEFGPNTLPIHTLNIAVSATADPTGAWNIYQYVDITFFIDYEKMSVWHNAYYLTSNDFNNAGSSYIGSSVYSMERDSMLAGAPTAVMIRTRLTDAGNNFYNMGTIGLEGMTPSTQSGLFAYPIAPTTMNVFEVIPNFIAGTQVIGPNTSLTISSYATPPTAVPEQGGGTCQTLGERMMFKLNYRNNSGTESIVMTHTVGVSGRAAVRWYELRRVSSSWTVYQQGTITGGDGNSRFMGGISMDGCGNIALMYDVSGTTANPSIRYTGRNTFDPLGTMTLPEATIINGASAHTSNSRWGDYNTTVQDYTSAGNPNDGSFWSTSQYGNQLTRIANYTITGGCTPTPGITPGTATLTAEGCVPSNAVIDPGETVTVSFCALNTGTLNTTNLVGTMQVSGGVIPISGPQNYGVLVFGGAAVCRSFSFSNTGTCGGTITVSIQWQDGSTNLGTSTWTFTLGASVVSLSQNFDADAAPNLPVGWTATNASGPAPLWVTSSAGNPAPAAVSLPNSIFVDDPASVSDKQIETPLFTPSAGTSVSFANNYNLESTFDGGVLEININSGGYQDIIAAGGSFVSGGYSGTISSAFGSPIAGRSAWTGNSSGFITTKANLPAAAAGQPCQLRFRMGSDNSVGVQGWRVDNFSFSAPSCCAGIPCTIALTSSANTDSQTVCINIPITNILYTTTGATGATFSGLPSGVTGAYVNGAITIGGTPTVTGTFNYTVTLTGGCSNVTAGGTITVIADNTIDIVCSSNSNTVFAGEITPSDSTTNLRSFRDGIVKTCAAPGICTAGIAGTFQYDLLTWTNPLASPQCVTVTYSTTSSNFTFVSAYNGAPVLSNLCTNWLADPGSSATAGTPIVWSFDAPASATINFLVTNVTNGQTADYLLVLNTTGGTSCSDTQTVCINSPITDIIYKTTGATGATVSGLPTGVTGTWANDTVTITGTPSVSGSFSYTVTLIGGCGNDSAYGLITVLDTVVITGGPNDTTVCSNNPATFNVTATGSNLNYQWQESITGAAGPFSNIVSGSPYSGETTATLTINPVTTGMNGYAYRCVVSNDCSEITSDTAVLTVACPLANDSCTNAIPIACAQTITGNTSTATIDSVPTCVTTLNTAKGLWYSFTGDGSIVTLSLCGSAYDTKIGVFRGSCGALICVTGNDDFCGLQSQVTFTSVNATNYYILVTGFGTATGAFTLTRTCVSTPVIVTTGTLLPFTTCAGNTSAEQTFTVSGSNLIANLVVTAPSGFEVSTTSGSGFGPSVTLVPSSGTVSPTLIYVRLAAQSPGTPSGNIACSSTGATTQYVAVTGTVYPNPSPVISCDSTFCAGQSTILDAGAGYSSYHWSTNATTRKITVTTANTFTVTVTDANGCSGSTSVTTVVYPLPTVSFSGLASSYNVSAPAATLTGSPSGGTFSGPGISGNKFYPSVAGVGGPYTIKYSYTNAHGCSKYVTNQTTVTGNCITPAKPGTISTVGGTAKVCPGESKTYSISAVAFATSYLWTPPAGATISSGQGSTSVTLHFNSGFTLSGNLSVASVCACGSSAPNTLLITRNTAPALPSVISGLNYGVCNQTAVPYSVTNVSGNTYAWAFSTTTASITFGQGTNAVKAKFNSNFTSGNITVKATNGCGTSATRSLAIKAAPAKPGAITGTHTACPNQQNVPYSIAAVSTATNYTWLGPVGSHIKAGLTTSSTNSLTTSYTSVKVNFGATIGAVQVKANNSCGSSAYASTTVTVNCRENGVSMSNDFDVVCYPIPAKAELNVAFNSEEEVANTIIITDVLGKTLLRQVNHSAIGVNNYTLDVSILSSGIYMIEVINGEHKSIQKIMIE